MDPERRFFEFRQTGDRTLEGVAVPYQRVTTLSWGKERFIPGAFGDVARLDVILNLHHRRDRPVARTGGGGLELLDSETELRIKAELPQSRESDDAIALVKANVLRGFSIEFHPISDSLVDGIREISAASLVGIALVDQPQYEASKVAARHQRSQPAPVPTVPWWLYV